MSSCTVLPISEHRTRLPVVRVVQSRAYISRVDQGLINPVEGGGEEGRRLGHGSTRTNTPSETVGQN